jgi:hypothetical protein
LASRGRASNGSPSDPLASQRPGPGSASQSVWMVSAPAVPLVCLTWTNSAARLRRGTRVRQSNAATLELSVHAPQSPARPALAVIPTERRPASRAQLASTVAFAVGPWLHARVIGGTPSFSGIQLTAPVFHGEGAASRCTSPRARVHATPTRGASSPQARPRSSGAGGNLVVLDRFVALRQNGILFSWTCDSKPSGQRQAFAAGSGVPGYAVVGRRVRRARRLRRGRRSHQDDQHHQRAVHARRALHHGAILAQRTPVIEPLWFAGIQRGAVGSFGCIRLEPPIT